MLTFTLPEAYINEQLAVEAFKEYRYQKGIVCKKCAGTHHYWLASKQQFQCKDCRFRTTLRSGTVLEGSKLPVSYFFIAVQMLKKNDNKITIEEFQRETRHRYYQPLWDFIRKVKNYIVQEERNTVLIDLILRPQLTRQREQVA